MLYIKSITIFADCDENLRKNLQTDKAFVFEKTTYEEFFAKNISVYAIVGKNGSGKSTILELMFRMVNNLSYVLLNNIQRDGADPLRYVYGVNANMDYELDGKCYRLTCLDDKVSLMVLDQTQEPACWMPVVDATVQVPIVQYNSIEFSKEGKDEIDIEQYRELAERLFYTIVVNYSMQAYVEQDFQDEKTECQDGKPYSPHCAEDAWVNGLFHKNDGYMCPIVLNPYRDKGRVDMNREMKLAQQRLEALLIYYKLLGIDYIDGYTLNTIKFKFNPDVINKYFDNKRLIRVLLCCNEHLREEDVERDIVDSDKKFKYVINLFKKVMEARDLNFQQQMMKTFGIRYELNKDEDLLAAELYMICKMINIVQKYPSYTKEKENILLEDNKSFDYLEILNPQPYDEYIDPMKAVAEKVKNQAGHIGLKVHRARKYILLSQKKKKLLNRKVKLGPEFDLSDYEKAYWKNERLNSVERINEVLPPSIFTYEIMLEKTSNHYDEEGDDFAEIGSIIPMRQMSSGERQFLFTTSTVVYHLQNLRSVKYPSPKYKNFNVILDEVEICFHPEYQRTFVHKLLSLLTRLGLNNKNGINIWIVTHSPFILSDIPMSNILYLKNGHQQIPTEEDNPFGANINDILKQSFFLNHGFMGEFSKNYVKSLYHYLYPRNKAYTDIPSMYKIKWDDKRAYNFIQQIGEPLLKTELMAVYRNSPAGNKHRRIEELKRELEALQHEENSSNG